MAQETSRAGRRTLIAQSAQTRLGERDRRERWRGQNSTPVAFLRTPSLPCGGSAGSALLLPSVHATARGRCSLPRQQQQQQAAGTSCIESDRKLVFICSEGDGGPAESHALAPEKEHARQSRCPAGLHLCGFLTAPTPDARPSGPLLGIGCFRGLSLHLMASAPRDRSKEAVVW